MAAVCVVTATILLRGIGSRPKGEFAGGRRQAESQQPSPVHQSWNPAQSTASAPSATRLSSTSGAEIGSEEQKESGLELPAPRVKSSSARSKPASAAAAGSQPTAEELLKEEMEVAQQLGKEFPAEVSALALLGDTYMRQGNSVQAATCWEGRLKANPKFALAHHCLGTTRDEAGGIRRGHPAVPEGNRDRSHDERRSRRPGGRSPPRKTPGSGRGTGARLRISPQESLEYFLLGQAYLQLNDYEKARKNYEKAAQLQPGDSRAYYGLANACDRLGESDKAQEYREKFQKLKAAESDAFYRDFNRHDDLASLRERVALCIGAGRICRHSGGLQEAEQHWCRRAPLAPGNTVCLGDLWICTRAPTGHKTAWRCASGSGRSSRGT